MRAPGAGMEGAGLAGPLARGPTGRPAGRVPRSGMRPHSYTDPPQPGRMARGYGAARVRRMVAESLAGSPAGMTCSDLSRRIGISRITLAKYLDTFAAEGLIRRRGAGPAAVWLAGEAAASTANLEFPEGYAEAQRMYEELVLSCSEDAACALVRGCISSGATASRLMTEAVVPAAARVRKAYDDGRIGNSELALMRGILSSSIRAASAPAAVPEPDPMRSAVLMAADPASAVLCEAAAAALRGDGWSAHALGDMSASINVLLDLDLQRLLARVWRGRRGMLAVCVFSDSEEGLNFFAESAGSALARAGRGARLVLCGPAGRAQGPKADLVTDSLGDVLQWVQTSYESMMAAGRPARRGAAAAAGPRAA